MRLMKAGAVARDARRLISFLSVDPTQDGWEREMRVGHEELGLRGIKLLPMYAGFSPDDPKLEPLWRYAEKNGLPVLLHMGTSFIAQAPLAFTLPRLMERAALSLGGMHQQRFNQGLITFFLDSAARTRKRSSRGSPV